MVVQNLDKVILESYFMKTFIILAVLAASSMAQARASRIVCADLPEKVNSQLDDIEKMAARKGEKVTISIPAISAVKDGNDRVVRDYCVSVTLD
jgi:hypothetical protein